MQRILLVEDNEMNRDLISRRLRRRGFEVLLAADGAAGVEAATREHPDLILMDMRLPVLDGYEATRLIKDNDEVRDVPIIGLSAHAMSGDADRAREAGCDDYDTKPIDWPRLLEKILGLLEQAADRKAQSGKASELASASSPGTGIHLLVVDDSAMRREMVTGRLASMGHAFVAVPSIGDALMQLETASFDGILLGVSVPGREGAPALEELLAATGMKVPIFMLCAIDAIPEAIDCLGRGAAEILPLPFRADEVRHRLDSHLELARHRQATPMSDEAAADRRRVEHLMASAMPATWIDELRNQQRLPPRRLDQAALLMWDLPDLLPLLDTEDSLALHRFQRLLVGFEGITSKHHLQVVDIDSLGVLSLVDTDAPDPVDALARCAWDLRQQAIDAGEQIRIVLHVGPVHAAVLGHRTWRFGLYGRTVRQLQQACAAAPPEVHLTLDAVRHATTPLSVDAPTHIETPDGSIALQRLGAKP